MCKMKGKLAFFSISWYNVYKKFRVFDVATVLPYDVCEQHNCVKLYFTAISTSH